MENHRQYTYKALLHLTYAYPDAKQQVTLLLLCHRCGSSLNRPKCFRCTETTRLYPLKTVEATASLPQKEPCLWCFYRYKYHNVTHKNRCPDWFVVGIIHVSTYAKLLCIAKAITIAVCESIRSI